MALARRRIEPTQQPFESSHVPDRRSWRWMESESSDVEVGPAETGWRGASDTSRSPDGEHDDFHFGSLDSYRGPSRQPVIA